MTKSTNAISNLAACLMLQPTSHFTQRDSRILCQDLDQPFAERIPGKICIIKSTGGASKLPILSRIGVAFPKNFRIIAGIGLDRQAPPADAWTHNGRNPTDRCGK